MTKLKITYSESISVLGLNSGASPEQIKDAYRILAKQYHPDVYQLDNGERFKEISSAYYFLKKHPEPPIQNQNQAHSTKTSSDYEQKRRAYHRRQREEKAQEAAQKAEMFKWLFVRLRLFVFVILIFNSLLLIDYFLPSVSEEVKITKVKTIETSSKTKAHYSYKAQLDNGMTFKLPKKEMDEMDLKEPFIISRSTLFREGESLRSMNGAIIIYKDYGLFRIFGWFIPLNIMVLIAYLYFVENNDYRLTLFLVALIIFIFQLFLLF